MALERLRSPTKRTHAKLSMVPSANYELIQGIWFPNTLIKPSFEGGDATVNAEITRRVLGGEQGETHRGWVLNVGMADLPCERRHYIGRGY